MIVLDTNVISEGIRPGAGPELGRWLAGQSAADLWTTAITVAEMRYGVALMPSGRRKDAVQAAVDAALLRDFQMRILPFDGFATAEAFAEIVAGCERIGRPIDTFDAQIAAIARTHGATLATRNTKHFRDCGIALVNPWEA